MTSIELGRRNFLKFLGIGGAMTLASPIIKAAEAAIPDPIPMNLEGDQIGFGNFMMKINGIWKKIGFVERFDYTVKLDIHEYPVIGRRDPEISIGRRYVTGQLGFIPVENDVIITDFIHENYDVAETRICLSKDLFVEGKIIFDTLHYSYDARCDIMDLDFQYVGDTKLVDIEGKPIHGSRNSKSNG